MCIEDKYTKKNFTNLDFKKIGKTENIASNPIVSNVKNIIYTNILKLVCLFVQLKALNSITI